MSEAVYYNEELIVSATGEYLTVCVHHHATMLKTDRG